VTLLRSFQRYIESPKELEVDFADFWIASILFESVFVESIDRGKDETLETRSVVERIVRRSGRPLGVKELMEEMGIPKDKAYARLRAGVESGTLHRANTPQKGNKKLFRPVPKRRFIPDPEKLFWEIPEVGDYVNFSHPLNGEWVTMSR
jgi:hypothetical protein